VIRGRGRLGAIAVAILMAGPAGADTLALLAPPAGNDARQAVAIGPSGEVYAPDGAGAWVRSQRFSTASTLAIAGRAGADIVAAGGGAVYKLAPNGWSAIRLHQKDKATMGGGRRAVAAVKRQLYALDRTRAGEPQKLAVAPANVLAIGAGKTIVIATARGLARVDGAKVTPIARAPRQVLQLIDDRWAIVARGAYDLRATKTIPWPAGTRLGAAAAGPDDSLVAVGTLAGKLELFTMSRGKLDREAIPLTPGGTAVGVAVDRAGRAVVALADGRLLVRDRGSWTTATVKDALPAARPGPPAARSK
jgi:hypothetical protein